MCCCYILDNKVVTILSTLGRLDFYNKIDLKSISTLHVQLSYDILLDIVMVCIYLYNVHAFVSDLCVFVSFKVTRTCESH